MWRDRRAIRVADDWLSKDLDLNTFSNIVECYVGRGGKRAFKRFRTLLTEGNLPDLYLADVVGKVSELIDTFRRSNCRLCDDAFALLAPFLDHPFPDVRWEAVYGLGIHRAVAYRAQIEKLTKDETRTLWRNSTVGHLARAAVKFIDDGDYPDFVNSLCPDSRSDAPAIEGKGGG